MIKKYRKIPTEVEAVLYDGSNFDEVKEFTGGKAYVRYRLVGKIDDFDGEHEVVIGTLEGDMIADIGDYIIKGVLGEFYPCKPEAFAKTYEEV